jgi:hypothetical protein
MDSRFRGNDRLQKDVAENGKMDPAFAESASRIKQKYSRGNDRR